MKRDNEDTDYTLTNTVDFYASHHPDIFGADLTDADTSAVNTPRSTLMGGMLADDSSYVHHTGRSQGSRSARMLAPREMPVHAGAHAHQSRPSRSEGSEMLSHRGMPQLASLREAPAHTHGDKHDSKTKAEAAAALHTPRLPYTPAGATEHRVQHFMKLAAARDRDRVLLHGPPRTGGGSARAAHYGLPSLAEGVDATDLDLTDDDTNMHLSRHVIRIRQGADGWSTLGPTASERGRVLTKLDQQGHVADMYTEAADLTESRWDDTAHDLLSTNMDDMTQLGPGSMIEEGDETRAGFESDDDHDEGPARLEEEQDAPGTRMNGGHAAGHSNGGHAAGHSNSSDEDRYQRGLSADAISADRDSEVSGGQQEEEEEEEETETEGEGGVGSEGQDVEGGSEDDRGDQSGDGESERDSERDSDREVDQRAVDCDLVTLTHAHSNLALTFAHAHPYTHVHARVF